MNDLLVGEELRNALSVIPNYDSSVRSADKVTRLLALNKMYQTYVATDMAMEIYTKLYLVTNMAMQKKTSELVVCQQNGTFGAIRSKAEYRGIIGGADSFSIIGNSGIGKSSAIERAIEVIGGNEIVEIETEQEIKKIIPIIQVQTPFDCSARGLLLEVLRIVDNVIKTSYSKSANRTGVTTDLLIGLTSQVLLNHVGLLVLDEIQHLRGHKKGEVLINMLTQIINNSSIAIAFVGTEDVIPFFEMKLQLSRRSVGLHYTSMPYGLEFEHICDVILKQIYTRGSIPITDELLSWLYEHSNGIVAILIAIIHDAQEIAIQGNDVLDIEAFRKAFDRQEILHKHIEISAPRILKKKKQNVQIQAEKNTLELNFTVADIAKKAKSSSEDIVQLLIARELVEVIQIDT